MIKSYFVPNYNYTFANVANKRLHLTTSRNSIRCLISQVSKLVPTVVILPLLCLFLFSMFVTKLQCLSLISQHCGTTKLSSTVGERPRDAFRPSVVSFNSVIPGAKSILLLLLRLQIYHCVR